MPPPTREQAIAHYQQQVADLNDEIQELRGNQHVEPHLADWRFDESELAETYLENKRLLDHHRSTPQQKSQASAKLKSALQEYFLLKQREGKAAGPESEYGEETATMLSELHKKQAEEKDAQFRLVIAYGVEAAMVNLIEDVKFFGSSVSRYDPFLAQLMHEKGSQARLSSPSTPAEQNQVVVARLTYELLSSTEEGREIADTLDSIYRYVHFLNKKHIALPREAQLFLRNSPPSSSSTPAAAPAEPSAAESSSSSPPAPASATLPSTSGPPPPRRRGPPSKKDRVGQLRRQLDSLGLSPRKRAIYRMDDEEGW
ncbi:hypothetical protein JCM8547_001104 [Rhodosporidiobolus lusitaniae]